MSKVVARKASAVLTISRFREARPPRVTRQANRARGQPAEQERARADGTGADPKEAVRPNRQRQQDTP